MFRSFRNSQIISKFIVDCLNKRLPIIGQVACQSTASKTLGYSAHIKGDLTNKLEFICPETHVPIPMYQVLDFDGNIRDGNEKPNVRNSSTKNIIFKIHLSIFELFS